MKIIKKIIAVLLLAAQSFGVNVYAANGDIEAYTKYTDICAYINHYIIQSYNINGYTVVVAEDLVNYGFNVDWNGDNRTLNISRNTEQNDITPYSIPYETAPNMIGKDALPVLSTDIRTYVNGVEAKSYNIDGKTVVDFESLSAFGPVNWDASLRVIKLWVEDGLSMLNYMQTPKSLPKVTMCSPDGRSINVYEYEVQDYLNVGWYKTQQEAQNVQNAAKNKQAVSKFRVGQKVVQNLLIAVKYGYVTAIDAANGKVKVRWTNVTDQYGNSKGTFAGQMLGLYSETWENASGLLIQ